MPFRHPDNEAVWNDIAATADRVMGKAPQVVPCPSCQQKNRVSWAQTAVRDARCGKCGHLLMEARKS